MAEEKLLGKPVSQWSSRDIIDQIANAVANLPDTGYDSDLENEAYRCLYENDYMPIIDKLKETLPHMHEHEAILRYIIDEICTGVDELARRNNITLDYVRPTVEQRRSERTEQIDETTAPKSEQKQETESNLMKLEKLMEYIPQFPENVRDCIANLIQYAYNANETAKRAEEKADIANNFVAAITKSQSFEETMEQVESLTEQITGCDKATFYRYDSSLDKFSNSSGNYREWNTYQDIGELKSTLNASNIITQGDKALIPITSAQGEAVGVIVANKADGFENTDFDMFKSGSQITNNITLAIQKDVAKEKATTDQLTGLKNRQAIADYLENTALNTLNKGSGVSVVMCDADKFKSVNDTYGHDAGDMVLKKYAEILKENTRTGEDCAFRWGGEEMVCILNCSPEKAIDISERIRQEMENVTFTAVDSAGKDVNFRVTLSMGVAGMSPDAVVTKGNIADMFNQTLKKADDAVYVSKATGRNQVIAANKNDKISSLAEKVVKLFDENRAEIQNIRDLCISRLKLNKPDEVFAQISKAVSENSSLYNKAEDLKYEIEKYCHPDPQNIFSITENSDTHYFMAKNNTDVKDILADVSRNASVDSIKMSKKYTEIDKSEFEIISKLESKFEININRDDSTVQGEAGRKIVDSGIRTFKASLEDVRRVGRNAKDNQQAVSDLWRVGNGRKANSDTFANRVMTGFKSASSKAVSADFKKKLARVTEWAHNVCNIMDNHRQMRENTKTKAESQHKKDDNAR